MPIRPEDPSAAAWPLSRRSLDYDQAAVFYDRTRGASPSLVAALLQALGPARGRRLLEVGCGTGNYSAALAQAGFRVIGLDLTPEMLRRAHGKLPGRIMQAGALRLPFPDGSIDCIVTVNVLHHLPDQLAAFREFRRVARACTVHHFTTAEQYRAHWVHHYFPLLRYEQPGEHPSSAEVGSLACAADFVDVQPIRFDYTDTVDQSLMPLRSASPRLLQDRAVRVGISTFRRLSPAEDAAGEAALAADLTSGGFDAVRRRYDRAASVVGDGTILLGRVGNA